MNKFILDLQIASNSLDYIPNKLLFADWVKNTTINRFSNSIEMTIRIVNKEESCFLNKQFSNKNYPTNVLAFPFIGPLVMYPQLLGDLVICHELVKYEAYQQNKFIEHYWAHLVIHGTLHLLGYTHNDAKKTKKMKAIEIKIMKILGYPNPFYLT